MLIISHRVNTIDELIKTPKKYGVEIDVRGYGSKLVLSHEPVIEQGSYDELDEYLKNFQHAFIIFNIKETGIEDQVRALAKKYNLPNFFLLDVEFPYLHRATRKEGFRKIAVRYSEAEPIEMALAQKDFVDWVWIDTNTILPLNPDIYQRLKDAGFKLCLVCPERGGRPQDIENYINYMKKNNIYIDAVMTSLNFVDRWEKF